ncbi:outer membrane protein [Aliidiomarina sp.]|uniref:outer membrane protein n=1 Tax=Aliidiomarina sp. TaxID=1872439 RepID=UPI003A4E13ED
MVQKTTLAVSLLILSLGFGIVRAENVRAEETQREYYVFGTALTQIYRMDMSDALAYSQSKIPEAFQQLPEQAPNTDKDKINGALGIGVRFAKRRSLELGYYTGISAESQFLPGFTPREQRDNGLMKLDFDYLELAALQHFAVTERAQLFVRGGVQLVEADIWYRDDARQRSYSDSDATRNFRRTSKRSFEGVAGAGIDMRLNAALGARLGYNFSSMGWRQGYLHFYLNF